MKVQTSLLSLSTLPSPPPPPRPRWGGGSWLTSDKNKTTVKLNRSATASLGQNVAVVERFKQESMYGLVAKKVVVAERWPLVEFCV